jgi:hypothetical protein
MIDRELPVMATLALAVGLLLAIGINSFAGSDGSDGEELRPAADRPASDIAALRLTPHRDRPPRRRASRRARRSATASRPAPRPLAAPPRAPTTTSGQSAMPQAPSPDPHPAPKPAPRPAPKQDGGGGGGGSQPFDDSG